MKSFRIFCSEFTKKLKVLLTLKGQMEALNADVEQTREVGVDIFALFTVSDPIRTKAKTKTNK
jgi:hypothetical protein